MTISTYTFTVKDCSIPPAIFQTDLASAQQILNALGCYWHDDEGSVTINGVETWSGEFLVGDTDFSNFVDALT